MVQPPDTSITAPLMYDASSEASQAYVFAISSGLPSRPIGTFSSIILMTLSGMCARIGVSMNPGQIALARMPLRPSSRAQVLTIPITPHFAAVGFDFLHRFLDRFQIDIADRDLGALGRELESRRATDALACPCDDRDLSGQTHERFSVIFLRGFAPRRWLRRADLNHCNLTVNIAA